MKDYVTLQEMHNIYVILNPIDFSTIPLRAYDRKALEDYYYKRYSLPTVFLKALICKQDYPIEKHAWFEIALNEEIIEVTKWLLYNVPDIAWGSEEIMKNWITCKVFEYNGDC